MTGIYWATAAGIGFGVFQTLHRRAGRGVDRYLATFILLTVSSVVLIAASVIMGDIDVLADASPLAILDFSLAGVIHFSIGWTFLTFSQRRIGAARTGALIGTSPLFGTVIAAVVLGEFLSFPAMMGVALVVIGVFLISNG
ncbi:MAG: DMT family transporter [Acidimicrobiia bacterium]|nr:DMT family transporter [Acidimicrobiia bacterium]